MTTAKERQLQRLRSRFEEQARELEKVGFLLKGTLLQRYKRCSSAGCACQSDPSKLHGPYWQWTSKVNGKTVTRAVRQEQVDRYREWMENGRRLEEIVQQLYDVSAQADALVSDKSVAFKPKKGRPALISGRTSGPTQPPNRHK